MLHLSLTGEATYKFYKLSQLRPSLLTRYDGNTLVCFKYSTTIQKYSINCCIEYQWALVSRV